MPNIEIKYNLQDCQMPNESFKFSMPVIEFKVFDQSESVVRTLLTINPYGTINNQLGMPATGQDIVDAIRYMADKHAEFCNNAARNSKMHKQDIDKLLAEASEDKTPKTTISSMEDLTKLAKDYGVDI